MNCRQCGNPVEDAYAACPYCGGYAMAEAEAGSEMLRTVNVKAGMPRVSEARDRVLDEIKRGKEARVQLLKIIHGHGSTGVGGSIRNEVRRIARRLEKEGTIKGYCPGEELGTGSARSKQLVDSNPQFRKNRAFRTRNPGITYVLLR